MVKEIKASIEYNDYTLNKAVKKGDDIIALYKEAGIELTDERIEVLLKGNDSSNNKPFIEVSEKEEVDNGDSEVDKVLDNLTDNDSNKDDKDSDDNNDLENNELDLPKDIETADIKKDNVETADIKPKRTNRKTNK